MHGLAAPVSSSLSSCRVVSAHPKLRRLAGPARGRVIALAGGESAPASNSDDNQSSPDDLGTEILLAREFEAAAKEKQTAQAQHLELLWRVTSERRRPQQCTSCKGSGETECSWCHGTGHMTVGDQLYCSSTGCHPCPVCHGTGAIKCQNCCGTGKRAAWVK